MKIRAIATIIDWDAESHSMVVINAGEAEEVTPTFAAKHYGAWELADDVTVHTASADGIEKTPIPAVVGEWTDAVIGDDILGELLDDEGNPIDVSLGDPSDPPASLDLTDDERAEFPQLDHDGDGAPGGSLPHDPPALTGRNKAELIAIADAEGVALTEGMTNKQIVEAIEAAREPAPDFEGDHDADGADGPPVE